jgi:putative membrane protein
MDQRYTDPRMILSAERTMLAWIRTGLALMGFGFVVAQFSLFMIESGGIAEHEKLPGLTLWVGFLFVVLGVITNIAAGVNYTRNLDRLMSQQTLQVNRWPLGRLLSIVLALIGGLMALYLLMLKL